jgi:hypothetical protein
LVQVSNSGEQIVTIDWEHSAFVDSVGSSYRVNLYPPESARYVTADQGPRTIDKPPVPVVPPGAHIDVFVMPERLPPSMFFLPPHEKEGAPLRFVLSTTGSSSPRAECIIRARLIKTETARSTEYPWPRDRDECLPELGCAEGLLCKEGICVDPRRPVVRPAPPKLSGKGGRCEMTEDCEPGLRCNLAFKMCREN